MSLKGWGFMALIALIIIVGLVLRYGNSSHYIASDFFNGTNNWFKTLSLQNLNAPGQAVYGNNPSGNSLLVA